jgi:DNA replication protein DnaC
MSRHKHPQPMRERIFQHLATLRILLPEDEFDQLLSATDKEKLSHLEFLERMLSGPANRRRERSIERRIRNARFRDPATLESFDWKFNARTIKRENIEELATGEFVRRRENLVFVGKSGLGKSCLIQGIGRRLCALGYRVRYITSADLLEDLTAASGDKTLPARVRYYSRFELLIIDEFGFDKLERREYPEAPSLLFKIIDRRNGRGSTALVTNIKFGDWTDYLGDPPLAMALLDRIVDGAIIQEFSGKSYRAHRAKRRGTSSSTTDSTT